MTNRKFTPPTEFPAEYVDGSGGKVTILGRYYYNKERPLVGFDDEGCACNYAENGAFEDFVAAYDEGKYDLHDIQKRITTWNEGDWDMTDGNTYAINKHLDDLEDWAALQEVTTELEQAEASIEELEGKLSKSEALLAKALEALGEAVYLLDPDEKDMARKAGVYRVVTTLAELSSVSCANSKGQDDG